MRVKGPNGLVFDLADDVAKGLLQSPTGEYVEVKDEPKPTKTAPKPSSKK